MASWQQVPQWSQAQQGTDFPWANEQHRDPSGHPNYNMAYAPVINVQCVGSEQPNSKRQEHSKSTPSSTRRPKSSRPRRPSPKRHSRQFRNSSIREGQETSRRQQKNNLRARSHHREQGSTMPPRPCDHCGGLHWNRRCPHLFPVIQPHGYEHSPLPSVPRGSAGGPAGAFSIPSSRDSTFVPASTASRSPATRVVRSEVQNGSNDNQLDDLLASFRGFCCAVGNPTMADLQSIWVKLHRQRLEGTLAIPVRERWNLLVRNATRERRSDEDGHLWTMLLV